MILWFYRTPTIGQSQRFDFDFWLFFVKSEISILKTSYLVYLYHFHSLHLIFTSLKPLLILSLTKSTLQLKSTLLSVDRPDTYTLLDFISYLFEFGFINFVWPTFLCFNDAQKPIVSPHPAPSVFFDSLLSGQFSIWRPTFPILLRVKAPLRSTDPTPFAQPFPLLAQPLSCPQIIKFVDGVENYSSGQELPQSLSLSPLHSCLAVMSVPVGTRAIPTLCRHHATPLPSKALQVTCLTVSRPEAPITPPPPPWVPTHFPEPSLHSLPHLRSEPKPDLHPFRCISTPKNRPPPSSLCRSSPTSLLVRPPPPAICATYEWASTVLTNRACASQPCVSLSVSSGPCSLARPHTNCLRRSWLPCPSSVHSRWPHQANSRERSTSLLPSWIREHFRPTSHPRSPFAPDIARPLLTSPARPSPHDTAESNLHHATAHREPRLAG